MRIGRARGGRVGPENACPNARAGSGAGQLAMAPFLYYDQYAKLANTRNIRDMILGPQGETIIPAALTYCTGSPVAEDLPWASTIADNVGNVTCVCISGMKCLLEALL